MMIKVFVRLWSSLKKNDGETDNRNGFYCFNQIRVPSSAAGHARAMIAKDYVV